MKFSKKQTPLLIMLFFMALLLNIILFSCTKNSHKTTEEPTIEFDFITNNYNIGFIETLERWYNDLSIRPLEPNFPHDSDGIILSEFNGQFYYHPVAMGFLALHCYSSYLQTSDSLYLEIAIRHMDKLIELGFRYREGLYFPYNFDFRLHGNLDEVMSAPWFSGMAEGVCLSLSSRIFESTNDPYYKSIADSIFFSFLNVDTTQEAWVSAVDSGGYYWIEEYPFNPRNNVLNGFLFAIIGLYDYCLITDNEDSEALFRGTCTTISRYLNEYRVPGSISYYCLGHKVQIGIYHTLIVNQLRFINKITDDLYFSAFADTLEMDYSP